MHDLAGDGLRQAPKCPDSPPVRGRRVGAVVSPERFGAFPLLVYDRQGSGQKVTVFRDRAADDY